jgi:hypothetical protein
MKKDSVSHVVDLRNMSLGYAGIAIFNDEKSTVAMENMASITGNSEFQLQIQGGISYLKSQPMGGFLSDNISTELNENGVTFRAVLPATAIHDS